MAREAATRTMLANILVEIDAGNTVFVPKAGASNALQRAMLALGERDQLRRERNELRAKMERVRRLQTYDEDVTQAGASMEPDKHGWGHWVWVEDLEKTIGREMHHDD